MQIYTQTKRPEKKEFLEKNSNEIIVEKAGYVTAKQRIEDMINAGRRLVDHRKANYDFKENEEIDENFDDPTRSPGFDPADASSIMQEIDAKMKAAKDEVKKQKDELKKQKEEEKNAKIHDGKSGSANSENNSNDNSDAGTNNDAD